MRIINVIVVKNEIVDSIDSFEIFEEQLSDDVVDIAEELFADKCREYALPEEEIEDCIEDGYYSGGNFSINLIWSEI